MQDKFVNYAQIEECAKNLYEHYGTKQSFKYIVTYLFERHQYQYGFPKLPTDISWDTLDDMAFFALLNELPINDIRSKKSEPHVQNPTIFAEHIMPDHLEVYALKYVPNIVEKMHLHNFFEVNYVMSGECKMIFENKIRELHTGDLCIIAPHSRHDVTVESGSVVLSLMLRQTTFETTFFKLLAHEDLLSAFFRNILYARKETANYMLFSTDNTPEIKSALKNIFMECHVADSYSNTCVISRIHLFFSLMLRKYSHTIQFYDEQQESTSPHENFMQIIHYIQNNYQTVTLNSLAQKFHYNPSYLSRLIKKNTDQTLLDILTNLKMSKASDLLINTSLKIEEIALQSGYKSADHFSRHFKKYYGISPAAYRQQNHKANRTS